MSEHGDGLLLSQRRQCHGVEILMVKVRVLCGLGVLVFFEGEIKPGVALFNGLVDMQSLGVCKRNANHPLPRGVGEDQGALRIDDVQRVAHRVQDGTAVNICKDGVHSRRPFPLIGNDYIKSGQELSMS